MRKKSKPPAFSPGSLCVENLADTPLTFWCMGCVENVILQHYVTAPRFGGGRCARGKCPVCGGQVCKALPAGEKKR